MARRPQDAEPQLPIFIDQSGWRRRTLQGVALVVSCACLGYLLFVGTLISGLFQPVGTHPPSTNAPRTNVPSTNAPVPSGRDQAGRQAVRSHADRDDHRRPPARRTAPPAGGLKQ
ncbi:hypothetical protein [Streptomyces rectiviolaceus]|uniref:hypothetical protein n=1 Tax=Streptomyces rectiviolaceus TaxID=332591 RepID=UPI0031E1BAA9